MRDNQTLVLLKDEGVLGVVVLQSPYISQVMFVKNGMQYIVMVENDDLVEIDVNSLWRSAEVLD